jgi:hypothetical protein
MQRMQGSAQDKSKWTRKTFDISKNHEPILMQFVA